MPYTRPHSFPTIPIEISFAKTWVYHSRIEAEFSPNTSSSLEGSSSRTPANPGATGPSHPTKTDSTKGGTVAAGIIAAVLMAITFILCRRFHRKSRAVNIGRSFEMIISRRGTIPGIVQIASV